MRPRAERIQRTSAGTPRIRSTSRTFARESSSAGPSGPASGARSAGTARRRQGLMPEGARRRRRLDAQHESPAPKGRRPNDGGNPGATGHRRPALRCAGNTGTSGASPQAWPAIASCRALHTRGKARVSAYGHQSPGQLSRPRRTPGKGPRRDGEAVPAKPSRMPRGGAQPQERQPAQAGGGHQHCQLARKPRQSRATKPVADSSAAARASARSWDE